MDRPDLRQPLRMIRRCWLLLLLAAGACASAGVGATGTPSGPIRGLGPALVGTWELVSTRVTRGESTLLDEGPPTVRALKVLNGTHYSLVTLRNGSFARAAAGRYRVVGDSYSETIELASGGGAEGRTYTFRIRVDGDRWTTDGGTGADRYHEVWRRVQ
jgi:hypothetical protein